MVTSQCRVRLPSTMSNRTRPDTFANAGSWPHRLSLSKNRSVASLMSLLVNVECRRRRHGSSRGAYRAVSRRRLLGRAARFGAARIATPTRGCRHVRRRWWRGGQPADGRRRSRVGHRSWGSSQRCCSYCRVSPTTVGHGRAGTTQCGRGSTQPRLAGMALAAICCAGVRRGRGSPRWRFQEEGSVRWCCRWMLTRGAFRVAALVTRHLKEYDDGFDAGRNRT